MTGGGTRPAVTSELSYLRRAAGVDMHLVIQFPGYSPSDRLPLQCQSRGGRVYQPVDKRGKGGPSTDLFGTLLTVAPGARTIRSGFHPFSDGAGWPHEPAGGRAA